MYQNNVLILKLPTCKIYQIYSFATYVQYLARISLKIITGDMNYLIVWKSFTIHRCNILPSVLKFLTSIFYNIIFVSLPNQSHTGEVASRLQIMAVSALLCLHPKTITLNAHRYQLLTSCMHIYLVLKSIVNQSHNFLFYECPIIHVVLWERQFSISPCFSGWEGGTKNRCCCWAEMEGTCVHMHG